MAEQKCSFRDGRRSLKEEFVLKRSFINQISIVTRLDGLIYIF